MLASQQKEAFIGIKIREQNEALAREEVVVRITILKWRTLAVSIVRLILPQTDGLSLRKRT